MLPTLFHPVIVGFTGSTGYLKKLWILRDFVSLVGEEQWAMKLPHLQLLERVHLLIEAASCGQRDSI